MKRRSAGSRVPAAIWMLVASVNANTSLSFSNRALQKELQNK